MKKLFVYGTLKKGFPLHCFVESSKLIKQNVKLKGFTLYLINGKNYNFPCAIINKNKYIIGEIYKVNNKDFKRIKYIETEAGYKEKNINGIYIFYIPVSKFKEYNKKSFITKHIGSIFLKEHCIKK